MNDKVLEQDWKTSNNVKLEDSALLAIRASNHVAIAAGQCWKNRIVST